MTKQRTFVPEDLYRLVLVGDPQISPDGRSVAFVRSHVEGEKRELRSHIWLVPEPGAPPRPYTRGPRSDSQPRWSPDGRRLAFVRQTGEGPKADRQIWIIDGRGGEAYQLTQMRNGAASPVWSPDGRYLAFVSAVDDAWAEAAEKARDAADETTGRAADETTPRAADEFNPVKPKTEADRKREEQRQRDEARLYTRFRYKFDHTGLFPPRRSHVWVVEVPETPPGAAEELPAPVQVTSGFYDHSLLDWSPDGRWIAAACSREDERRLVMDIWLFPAPVDGAATGPEPARPVKLTSSDGVFADARWSPDGKKLAVIGHHREFRGATLHRLWLFPAPGQPGEKVCLTAHWDRGIGGTVNSDVRPGMAGAGLTWSPDGRAVYFVADDRGATHLYRVDVDENGPAAAEPKMIVGGPREIYGFSLSADGTKAALAVSEFHNPGDIYLVDLAAAAGGGAASSAASGAGAAAASGAAAAGPAEIRLTAVNEGLLRDTALPEVMEIEFESFDGLPIHGWIMKPVGFEEGRRYPAVLQIHGGPHTAWGCSFSLEMQLMAAWGYAVIFVNPRGSTGYGQRFAFGCVDDYGGADYKDLMAAVDYAVSLGFIDENSLAVTGGSYGGFMTNWIVTQTSRFKAAITHRSISNWISFWGVSDIGPNFMQNEFGVESLWAGFDQLWERSPLKHAQNIETPVLICHSEHDLRCPMEQAEQLYLALKWLGKPAELLRHPRSNHDLTRTGPPPLRVDRFRHIRRFLQQHVPAR
ncbi:MAG: S9 family peptidase [Limnochordales bacterium]